MYSNDTTVALNLRKRKNNSKHNDDDDDNDEDEDDDEDKEEEVYADDNNQSHRNAKKKQKQISNFMKTSTIYVLHVPVLLLALRDTAGGRRFRKPRLRSCTGGGGRSGHGPK